MVKSEKHLREPMGGVNRRALLLPSPFRAGSLKRMCVGRPVYATSVHRGYSTSKTKALMKTEATSDFHRESGTVRSRQMSVDFLSLLSRKPQRCKTK